MPQIGTDTFLAAARHHLSRKSAKDRQQAIIYAALAIAEEKILFADELNGKPKVQNAMNILMDIARQHFVQCGTIKENK